MNNVRFKKLSWLALICLAVNLWSCPTAAVKLPVPRYVSLRSEEANVRVGPGRQYPIQWVLKRRFLPLEVIAEFDTWRKIKDSEGEVLGWIHQSLLSGIRTGVVMNDVRPVRRKPSDASFAIARLEPGVGIKLLKCQPIWCRIQVDSVEGWMERVHLWGVYPNEIIK